MIGQYLATLTPEQEDRVLTRPMSPYVDIGGLSVRGPSWCLLERAYGVESLSHPSVPLGAVFVGRGRGGICHRGAWYDALCGRFGTDRINALIRQRILRNRLAREMAKERSTSEAVAV